MAFETPPTTITTERLPGNEKPALEHHSAVSSPAVSIKSSPSNDIAVGRDFTTTELPPGYFRTPYFWGSLFAIGMSLMCGVAGFSFIAPLLAFVTADLGKRGYVGDANWIALTYTLTGAVGLMIVGRLSDIFGRRWFFITGSSLAVLGSIVCATAPTIPAMIAGETLIGLGSAAQLSFAFAVSELVPNKYRVLANAYCYLWLILPNAFGPVIGYAFQYHSSVGWRGSFYLLIAMNVVCTASWYFFYYPPDFRMKQGGSARKWQFIREFDYIGMGMATLGLLLFLMGLSWGGSLHPWGSPHVISTVVVGFLLLVGFFVYEAYVPLKEPMLPIHLVRNRGWLVSILIWSIGASVYYAFAVIWPSMVTGLYANGRNMWAGWTSGVVGAGITLGEILAGFAKNKMHWAIRGCFLTGSALLAAMASCTPETPTRAIILLLLGTTAIGANECLSSVCATLCVKDQREIGTAIGVGGSSRSFVSSLASTVYTVVLSNRLATTIPAQVPPALIQAGLPANQTATWIAAYAAGGNFDGIQGMNAEILAAGTRAYKFASADAYRTVFLTTLAFSGVGIILTFFAPNVDHMLTSEVAVTLGKGDGAAEKGEEVREA